jgi:DNA-binding XRE family transcriptional regulator
LLRGSEFGKPLIDTRCPAAAVGVEADGIEHVGPGSTGALREHLQVRVETLPDTGHEPNRSVRTVTTSRCVARDMGQHSTRAEPRIPANGRRPPSDDALLVGQTELGRAVYLGNVPTRPSQNNPDRVAQWARWRAMVGANIRELRLQQGMTQEALALTSGVTRNVLIAVERHDEQPGADRQSPHT